MFFLLRLYSCYWLLRRLVVAFFDHIADRLWLLCFRLSRPSYRVRAIRRLRVLLQDPPPFWTQVSIDSARKSLEELEVELREEMQTKQRSFRFFR